MAPKEKNATRTSVGRKKTNAAKVIVLDRKTERKKGRQRGEITHPVPV